MQLSAEHAPKINSGSSSMSELSTDSEGRLFSDTREKKNQAELWFSETQRVRKVIVISGINGTSGKVTATGKRASIDGLISCRPLLALYSLYLRVHRVSREYTRANILRTHMHTYTYTHAHTCTQAYSIRKYVQRERKFPLHLKEPYHGVFARSNLLSLKVTFLK